MNFIFDNKYVDPRHVDLRVLAEEVTAGNPYAALVRASIHIGGFRYDHTFELGYKAAAHFLDQFLSEHPGNEVCHAARAFFKVRDDFSSLERIGLSVKPLLKKLDELAVQGDHYALMYAGLIYDRGIGVKKDLNRSDRYLQEASGPGVTSWEKAGSLDEPFAGDAVARYEYGLVLNSRQSIFRSWKTSPMGVPPKQVERAQKDADAIGHIPIFLNMAAAHGRHVRALNSAGIMHTTAEPGLRHTETLTREDLDEMAERFLKEAIHLGWQNAETSLAELYLRQGKFANAEILFQRLIDDDIDWLDAKLGLARVCDETGRYDKAYTLYREVAGQFASFQRFVPMACLVEFNYAGDSGHLRRPGFVQNEEQALEDCVKLFSQPGVDPAIRKRVEPAYRDLLSRTWVNDPEKGFRPLSDKDRNHQLPKTILPSDPSDSLAFLLNEASKAGSAESLNLIVALAERFEQGIGVEANRIEAIVWREKAATKGHHPSIFAIYKHTLEANPEDLPRRVILAAKVTEIKNPSGLPMSEVNAVKKWLKETLEAVPPRVWRLTDDAVPRPLDRKEGISGFQPSELMVISDNLEEAAMAYSLLHESGSSDAGLHEAAVHDKLGRKEKAFSQYYEAAELGNAAALLEVAERLSTGSGTPLNLEEAFHVCRLLRDRANDLRTEPERQRLTDLTSSLMPQLWTMSASGILNRAGTAYRSFSELPKIGEADDVAFAPVTHDNEGMVLLLSHQEDSSDAAVEIALRYLHGQGCDQDLTEAFKRLSLVLFKDTALAFSDSAVAVLPPNFPDRAALEKTWRELARMVQRVDASNQQSYVVPGYRGIVGPLTIPKGEGARLKFHQLVCLAKD